MAVSGIPTIPCCMCWGIYGAVRRKNLKEINAMTTETKICMTRGKDERIMGILSWKSISSTTSGVAVTCIMNLVFPSENLKTSWSGKGTSRKTGIRGVEEKEAAADGVPADAQETAAEAEETAAGAEAGAEEAAAEEAAAEAEEAVAEAEVTSEEIDD